MVRECWLKPLTFHFFLSGWAWGEALALNEPLVLHLHSSESSPLSLNLVTAPEPFSALGRNAFHLLDASIGWTTSRLTASVVPQQSCAARSSLDVQRLVWKQDRWADADGRTRPRYIRPSRGLEVRQSQSFTFWGLIILLLAILVLGLIWFRLFRR